MDKAKVLLKIEVCQNFKMKPKNYIEGLFAVISHLESEAVVFDCSIKYENESSISSVSSKCQPMCLILYCYMKLYS